MSLPLSTFSSQTSGQLITLKSGYVAGAEELKRRIREVLFTATFNSAVDAFAQMEPNLAFRTGALRQFTRLAVANAVNGQKGQSNIQINFDTVIQIASSIRDYIKYHYVQGAQFNPNFDPSGYRTRLGKPIDFNDFETNFNAVFQDKLRAALNVYGFDAI